MDEQDRELVIKETRLAALHDVEMALAKLEDERGGQDEELRRVSQYIRHYIGLRISEVNQDKADRARISRPLWQGRGAGDETQMRTLVREELRAILSVIARGVMFAGNVEPMKSQSEYTNKLIAAINSRYEEDREEAERKAKREQKP